MIVSVHYSSRYGGSQKYIEKQSIDDEIINFLLADTPEASFIRWNTIFHIVPMHNPDGVELGYSRENANGLDIESGWDDNVLEPEVSVLQNRFLELSFAIPNPIQVALNMHSAYACKRYFVYHHENGTSSYFNYSFSKYCPMATWTNGSKYF